MLQPSNWKLFLLKAVTLATAFIIHWFLLYTLFLIFLARFLFSLKPKNIYQRASVVFSTVLLSLTFALSFKTFTFNVYRVPSESMENTVLQNDIILVSKIHYGPRLSGSIDDLPWIGPIYKSLVNGKNHSTKKEYNRLKGFTKPKVNDILTFQSTDGESVLLKRCIGLPNDTIQIIAGQVKINTTLIKQPATGKFRYLVKSSDTSKIRNNQLRVLDSTILYMDSLELHNFRKNKSDEFEISTYNENQNEASIDLYVYNTKNKGSRDYYGPIVIPSSDMTLKVTDLVFKNYIRLIKEFEEPNLQQIGNLYYIRGKVIKEYRFKENYYFVLGDNRYFSRDSRFFGLIPESYIEGKMLIHF